MRTARANNLKISVDPEVPVIGTTSVKLYVDALVDDNAIWRCRKYTIAKSQIMCNNPRRSIIPGEIS